LGAKLFWSVSSLFVGINYVCGDGPGIAPDACARIFERHSSWTARHNRTFGYMDAANLSPAVSENLQRIQHRLDAGDFVGAKEIGLPQCGQDGEEGFSAAHFLAEILEGVRKGVAGGETQRA